MINYNFFMFTSELTCEKIEFTKKKCKVELNESSLLYFSVLDF